MKKTISVLVLILALCCGAVFFTACGGGDDDKTEVKTEFTFTGSATIGGNLVTAKLEGKSDKTFVFTSGSLTDNGTYVFTDGKGYTFTFSDGTKKETEFDTATKEHKFTYTVTGGEVTLTLSDTDFVPSEPDVPTPPEPEENVVFKGTWEGMGMVVDIDLILNDDNTCKIDWSFDAVPLDTTGTYTFFNNVFTVTREDGAKFASEYDPADGSYTIAYSQQGGEALAEFDLVYKPEKAPVFSGETKDSFGDMKGAFDLTMSADGKAKLTCTNIDFLQGALDREGTYTFKNGVFSFTFAKDGGEDKYTASYDFVSGSYKFTIDVRGDIETTVDLAMKPIDFPVTSPVFKGETKDSFGDMKGAFDLTMSADGKAKLTCTNISFLQGALDREGTYTFANNVFTFTFAKEGGTDVYTTSFDAETGVYSVTVDVRGDIETTVAMTFKL